MLNNYLRRYRSPRIKKYLITTVIVVIALILLIKFNPLRNKPSTIPYSNKVSIKEAIATTPLNKEFKFPLKNDKGETIEEIKYILENVELRDEIVVQGRKASAVSGRTFLILNLKIANDSSKTISMNTKDYVRLIVNNNENEPLSPSIHNDPVVVDAISVKPTRIGFAINETDKGLKIKVGEIKGDKTAIDINFK